MVERSYPDMARLSDEWQAEAKRHALVALEGDCEVGDDEWCLHRESARIYRRCADQLVTVVSRGILDPAQRQPDRDAIYRAIESNVRSEPDKHFVDRRWMVGINDAVDAILALTSTDRYSPEFVEEILQADAAPPEAWINAKAEIDAGWPDSAALPSPPGEGAAS